MKQSVFITIALLLCIGCNGNHFNKASNHDNENTNLHSTYINEERLMSILNESSNRVTPIEIDYSDNNNFESAYKYNYKNGGYYNYDICGYDEDGNYVSGNVDIDEYGDGYVVDEYGNEKYIEVEWVDWGVMEGYDEDGVYYEFEVE